MGKANYGAVFATIMIGIDEKSEAVDTRVKSAKTLLQACTTEDKCHEDETNEESNATL